MISYKPWLLLFQYQLDSFHTKFENKNKAEQNMNVLEPQVKVWKNIL